MPILGQPGCHNIGRMCPEGDWPDELPSEVPLLFVHPEGSGDGLSMDNPMGSIQMALDSSISGGWVIVAKGEYNESIVSRRGINIRGACAMETLINPEFSPEEEVLLDSLSLELKEDYVAGVRVEGEGGRGGVGG